MFIVFEDIGAKIKIVSKVLCWVGIIAAVIAAFVMFSLDEEAGLLFLIAGPLLSWINSLFVYGFGELIEKTNEIAENTRNSDLKIEKNKAKMSAFQQTDKQKTKNIRRFGSGLTSHKRLMQNNQRWL